MAIANEYISRNPFAGIKFHEVPVNKEFLTMDEITRIAQKEFAIHRLELVRDVFLFSIWTGLAFIDVYNLKQEHIVTDNNGNLWIRKTREKTNVCVIFVKYYANFKEIRRISHLRERGTLLPVMCNQKYNSYLKLPIYAGSTRGSRLLARYTFASIIALANNVSLSNVAKMSAIPPRMTQHYAKVLDQSILKDMQAVDLKMNSYQIRLFDIEKAIYLSWVALLIN